MITANELRSKTDTVHSLNAITNLDMVQNVKELIEDSIYMASVNGFYRAVVFLPDTIDSADCNDICDWLFDLGFASFVDACGNLEIGW